MAEIPVKRGSKRWWFAALLLVVMTVTFLLMGRWQLSRADERRVLAAQIEQGRHASAQSLSQHSTLADLQAWQRVSASGRWLPQNSVLLDNRALQGRPGLWLAMPLALQDGATVLVLRGWLPRPLGDEPVVLDIKQTSGEVTIYGEMATHVPRLYELQADGPLQFGANQYDPEAVTVSMDLKSIPWRQNLSVEEMSAAIHKKLLPFVIMQTSEDDSLSVQGHALSRDWPEPSVDADKNMGYAMQWFMFAAIAFGALVILIWRSRRRETITA